MSKRLLFGTHNSGTSSKLIWWQRLFAPILHLTSRCQSRTISEQINDGIVLFNFQVCYYRNDWYFSHGMCIYVDKLFDSIHMIQDELNKDKSKKIYIQLSLDNNFLIGQNKDEYKKLVNLLITEYSNERLIFINCLIENGDILYNNPKHGLKYVEHYWTSSWGKLNGTSWLDKLPLPKRHAKKFNKDYIKSCKKGVLMLDFYDIK
jgi:hypothetical protein